jgi:hypothetical protein
MRDDKMRNLKFEISNLRLEIQHLGAITLSATSRSFPRGRLRPADDAREADLRNNVNSGNRVM